MCGEDMRIKTIIKTCFGFLFLVLGAVGVFMPIWPTTPFVLLCVACFSSTPRIKNLIMKISFFREHIENYNQRKGLSHKTTCISLIWLWGMLIISALMTQKIWIYILLFFIGFAVSNHILFMAKAKDRNKENNL